MLHRGRSLKAELAHALPTIADPRDRALVEAICFAALRQHARATHAIAAWMPKPPAAKDGELVALLHAGFAQLDPLALPAHAAVAATVDAARVLGRAHQSGLVNALLRRAQRDGLPAVALNAAWPRWLCKTVRGDWPDAADAIFAASARPAPLWLRVNRLQQSRDDYATTLRNAGIDAVAPDGLLDALRIDGSLPVSSLPGFGDGAVSVQDGAAQCVADALSLPIGARVLDACIAPGGKASHLLERDPTVQLTGLDVDPARLSRVRETFARLRIGDAAMLQASDAADVDAWWDGVPFDAVLLDAPCTATGIVRRQPDILLHRRAADLVALVTLQRTLLDTAWRVLTPGGALLYATCSILRAENSDQIEGFLMRHADAVVEPLDASFGHVSGPGRQRLPGEDDMDGFFYARLRKR